MKIPAHVNVNELAAIIGVSRQTIHSYQRDGLIPKGRKMGAKVMFKLLDVLTVLEFNGIAVGPIAAQILQDLEHDREFCQGVMEGLKASKYSNE